MRIPDSVDPIIGYRYWKVLFPGYLVDSNKITLFEPRKRIKARCTGLFWTVHSNTSLREAHTTEVVPVKGCYCGIHAYKTLPKDRHGFPRLYAKVALWGKVLEHEEGYRAQYAYPLEFWHNWVFDPFRCPESLLEGVEIRYGVRVRRLEPPPPPPTEMELYKLVLSDPEASPQAKRFAQRMLRKSRRSK